MLLPHQHAALVAELKRLDAGPEKAFAYLSEGAGLQRLGRTRWMTQAEWDALRPKDRERLQAQAAASAVCVVPDAMLAEYPPRMELPRDVPGFPNKLRREWFEAALREARG